MKNSLFIFMFLLASFKVKAIEGLEGLERQLFEKNQEVLALQKETEAKEALYKASFSGFYPTINMNGGYEKNKTDERPNEVGYLGFVEGKLNVFKGFKDQALISQREADLKLSQIELEFKKRELRLVLIEIASDMILLHQFQNILDEESKVTQTQKQMAAKKTSSGLTGPVDNYEMELRENEIKIEQAQINQKHQEAHQRFFKIFGEDIDDKKLEKLEFSKLEKNSQFLKENLSFENTLDFQREKLLAEKADYEKNEVKSEFLPSIDFTYSFGRLTPSEASPLPFNESKYGVMITIPLFSGFETYYKTKAMNLQSQSIEKQKWQKRNEVLAEINTSKIKLEELSTLLQLNDQKLISAQKYFDLTLSEYRRGIKNSPDLVGATERLFSSKKKKFELLKELELLKVKVENFKINI